MNFLKNHPKSNDSVYALLIYIIVFSIVFCILAVPVINEAYSTLKDNNKINLEQIQQW